MCYQHVYTAKKRLSVKSQQRFMISFLRQPVSNSRRIAAIVGGNAEPSASASSSTRPTRRDCSAERTRSWRRSLYRRMDRHGFLIFGIVRIPLARQSLLNLFERRRGPRDRLAPLWKVWWWRGYERAIGDADLFEPAVPASCGVAIGVSFAEIARTLRQRLDGGVDRARAGRAAGVTPRPYEAEPSGLVMAAEFGFAARRVAPGSDETPVGGEFR